MTKILNILITVFSTKIGDFLIRAVDLTIKAFSYLEKKRKDKKQKEHNVEIKKQNDKISDACDNGNIKDLIEAVDSRRNT